MGPADAGEGQPLLNGTRREQTQIRGLAPSSRPQELARKPSLIRPATSMYDGCTLLGRRGLSSSIPSFAWPSLGPWRGHRAALGAVRRRRVDGEEITGGHDRSAEQGAAAIAYEEQSRSRAA